jgi:hypothetical protein
MAEMTVALKPNMLATILGSAYGYCSKNQMPPNTRGYWLAGEDKAPPWIRSQQTISIWIFR